MSEQEPKRVKLHLKYPDGIIREVQCTPNVAAILLDDSADSSIKELITSSLVRESDKHAGPRSIWTKETEKLLMEKLKATQNSSTKLKNKWLKISSDVNASGYHFTPEQCRLKIKALKEKYERRKMKKHTSGESFPPDDNDIDLLEEEISVHFPDMHSYVITNSDQNKNGASTEVTAPSDEDSSEASSAKKRRKTRRCKTRTKAQTRHGEAVNSGDGPPPSDLSDVQQNVSGIDRGMEIEILDDILRSRWTDETEKLLLEKYKAAQNSSIKLKKMWLKISSDINILGYHFTPEQCRLKIKCWKEKYERQKKKQLEQDDLEGIFVHFQDTQSTVINSEQHKNVSFTGVMAPSDEDNSEATSAKKSRESSRCQTKEQVQTTRKETGNTGDSPTSSDLSDIQQRVSGNNGGMESGIFDVRLLLRKRSSSSKKDPSTATEADTMETGVDLSTVTMAIASDASDKEADLPSAQTSTGSSNRKKATSQLPAHVNKLMDYESLKSESLSELVSLERERLNVEKRRLAVEERQAVALEKLVSLKQEKLSLLNKSQVLSLSPSSY